METITWIERTEQSKNLSKDEVFKYYTSNEITLRIKDIAVVEVHHDPINKKSPKAVFRMYKNTVGDTGYAYYYCSCLTTVEIVKAFMKQGE